MSQFNMPPGVSTRDIPTGDECEGFSDRDVIIEELLEALRQFAECELNESNCASLEVATARIRGIARAAIQKAKS